jgi:succinate dehydrogenase hydrophobic anchor subunit
MDAIVYLLYYTNKIGVNNVLSGYLKAMILKNRISILLIFSCCFYVLRFL